MTGSSQRLLRTSSPQIVARYIRQRILRGELSSGERLRQGDIATALGISRIPVREAIIGLDRDGWLRLAPSGGGAYVTELRRDDILDHYELRGVAFGLVAARAAAAMTEESRKRLQQQLRLMRSTSDVETFSRENDGFLDQIARLAASPGLRSALRVSPSLISTGFFEFVPGARAIQEAGAAALMRALKTSDQRGAELAMRRLLCRQGSAVVKTLESRGRWADHDRPPPSGEPPRDEAGTRADQANFRQAEGALELVVNHVRQLIIAGKIHPGQRICQDDIGLAVGVSRTPVREGIIALEREGWVRIKPHRGAFAVGMSDQAIFDHHALYGRYLAFAARRVIDHRNPGDCGTLDSLASKVATRSTEAALERAARDYIERLAILARSTRLDVTLRVMPPVADRRVLSAIAGVAGAGRAGIGKLQEAIESGDRGQAERACITMLEHQAASLIAFLNTRDPSQLDE
jgi:DNA-binding GntR family transcriptional regulator